MDLVIQLYLYKWESEEDPYRRYLKQVRQMEIDECFLRNLHHPLLQTFHVLCDSEGTEAYYRGLACQYEKQMKCIFTVHGRQPTYADMLRYIAKNIHDRKCVCIQNSDIYIDPAVSLDFVSTNATADRLIALTRHEHTNGDHSPCTIETCPLIWDYMGSHDTFIFHTPIPNNFPYHTLEYPQNVYGGETIFMKAWKDSGKSIVNPCFDIRIFHRHQNRVSFAEYPTLADGYLCNCNPSAPEGRHDIANALKTIFTS